VTLEKQPQPEIRVVVVEENDHKAFWHYENTTTRRDREGSLNIAKE
jgi:pyridoxine/pyridoxamine 5'-phosphate oxidase